MAGQRLFHQIALAKTGAHMPNKKASLKTILTAGLVAGTLDLTLAIVFFAIQQHAPFVAVPQSVASGLIGVRAFTGGVPTAILGIALHYFIALAIAGIYYAASLRLAFLNRHAWHCGAAYGIAVYLFMQHIVLPLSAHPHNRSFGHAWLIANIASHIFFIGITIALITRYYAGSRTSLKK